MSLINFDKDKVKEQLTLDNLFQLIDEWGGDPQYTSFGILSSTICHNPPGCGSRKLYIYENTSLCRCFTGCEEPTFDIFQLAIKVFKIQYNRDIDLNDAVRYIAAKFGIAGDYKIEENSTEDWKIFDSYSRIQDIENKEYRVELKEYDASILPLFNYDIEITPWLKEGMTEEVLDYTCIGYYPGGDQITIPHFDAEGRLVGLRGRAMAQDDAERWGKYRPLRITKDSYNHPLGMNLYGLNWARDAIQVFGKAIVFESEKSVLLYMSYFGIPNNIAVACCGSNVSAYHIQALKDAGAKEIIIALDRQFQELGDSEYIKLTNNLTGLHNKYGKDVLISFMFDKKMITPYKAAPIDCGKDIFLQLFQERITL